MPVVRTSTLLLECTLELSTCAHTTSNLSSGNCQTHVWYAPTQSNGWAERERERGGANST